MLGMNLLSCLMLPMIVARALRSVMRVCSWSCARTYCSLGVQSSHFQVSGITGISTGVGAVAIVEAHAEPVTPSARSVRIRLSIKNGRLLSLPIIGYLI